MKTRNIFYTYWVRLMCLIISFSFSIKVDAQSFKEKMKSKFASKSKTEMYECGYVHKISLKEKLNPMRALQKGLGESLTDGGNSDLGKTAVTVYYQAHLHPQGIMRYPTQTPGWETCGDAVFAGFTNRSGLGLSSTDGKFLVNNEEVEYAGVGTYFHGFDPSTRGEKDISISSSNGNKASFKVGPAAPLEIMSVNGQSKNEDISIDGSEDLIIELSNGTDDPQSQLHVQLICKLAGTPVIYDLIVTKARDRIVVPKEAFKNFEGSPSPFASQNTLIVNRVNQTIVENTDVGALRTISAYMDWVRVTITGEITKNSIVTAGFDESKNTKIDIDLTTTGTYNFIVRKSGPFTAPPVKLINNIAVASFMVRGNLQDTRTTTSSSSYTITKTKKWFPELSKDTWQKLADNMYALLSEKLTEEMGWNLLPLDQIVASEAYAYAKPIKDKITKTFVEVGAGGTKRILTSSSVDLWKDLGITFGADFVSQRLVKELNVDAVLAITIDLNFNFDTEGLDPKVSIVAFAPDVSYKTTAKYFTMQAATQSQSLDESRNYTGGVENVLFQMIKGETFNTEFINALKELSAQEEEYPVYEALWQVKL